MLLAGHFTLTNGVSELLHVIILPDYTLMHMSSKTSIILKSCTNCKLPCLLVTTNLKHIDKIAVMGHRTDYTDQTNPSEP